MILLIYTIPVYYFSAATFKAGCIYNFPYLITLHGFLSYEALSLNPVKSTSDFHKFDSSATAAWRASFWGLF